MDENKDIKLIFAVKWLTVEDVANKLKVDERVVYDLIKGGDLGAIKVKKQYRISALDFVEYVEKQRV